jgi:cytosine/adenosine deaminase-related metal-dependent hydrolase
VSTLIHNATLLTPRDGEVRVFPAHSFVFDSRSILELAPAGGFEARILAGEFSEVIRADDLLVIPGLINTHHHLYQAITRCLPGAQDQRLFGWLRTLYAHWERLDHEAVRVAAQVSIAELLVHGCTTTVDHFYLFPPASNLRLEAVLEAADTLGIRLHLGRGSMTLGASRGGLPPDELVERDEDVLVDCVRALDAFHDPKPYALRRIDLAPCSPFNVTRELLRDTAELARERSVLLHTHLAETLEEQAYCLERFHRRPVRYLEELGWLGSDVYLAHCVHLNDDEIVKLARTGTGVSHNPTSNQRLGSGIAPLKRLLAAGVPVGLGVDGSSSNDGGNLLATAKLALLSARVLRVVQGATDDMPAELMPAREAFKLATVGGAACLHRDELGHLNPGAAADFAMFRMDDLALAGAVAHDPVAALMLCDAPRAERVFVAGREVVREGRIVALDELALGARLNELVARGFSR